MPNLLRLLILTTCALSAVEAQQYLISTYAGGAPRPGSGSSAASIAVDASGNIYFVNLVFGSPNSSNAVFKLDPNGVITLVAGNSRTDYSGDGGSATSASLNSPWGLTLDSAGNLYIVDAGNQRVRRVSPDGIITTVAGGGTAVLGDGGPATSGQLNYPFSITVDRVGNLFIGELGRVRKVTPAGIITTVAGGGPDFPGEGGPATNVRMGVIQNVAVDIAGDLFLADSGDPNDDIPDARIRKVSPDGIITTVAGAGVCCFGPMAVDPAGNLFISDGTHIRKISPTSGSAIVAGTDSFGASGDGGPATQAQLSAPIAMAFDAAGNLLLADSTGHRLRKISTNGIINTVAGGVPGSTTPPSGDGGAATSASLQLAVQGLTAQSGVAVDAAGNLFLAETANHRIRKVSPSGSITTVAGVGPRCPGRLLNDCVPPGDGGPATSAALSLPTSVAVDSKGNLFIADYGNLRVRKVSADGIITTVAGNGSFGSFGDGGPATAAQVSPSGVAVDGAGNLFVSEGLYGRIRKISPDGIITTIATLGLAGCITVDSAGNLLIAGYRCDDLDNCSSAVGRVSASGSFSVIADSAALMGDYPTAVALDPAGNVLIASLTHQRINRISPNGSVTTVAGGLLTGYSGDGGLAVKASLNYPFGLASDAAGNVYIADGLNQVVRVLRPATHFISAVADAASQAPAPISPGKIVVIYGVGLGPSQLAQNQPVNGVFGTQLGGTSVSINGVDAPILYTSATQVAAIVPYSVVGATAQVTITWQGQTSNVFQVAVAPSAPGLFTSNQTGAGQAAAVNLDGTANTAVNPIKIGDLVSLYATGSGQTSPAGVDGKLGGFAPILPVRVTVDGIPATVQYAGGAAGLVAGLMQVNIQIPKGVRPGGYVPVVLQVGNASTTTGAVWIAVSN